MLKTIACIFFLMLGFISPGLLAEWYNEATIQTAKKMHCDALEYIYGNRDVCPK